MSVYLASYRKLLNQIKKINIAEASLDSWFDPPCGQLTTRSGLVETTCQRITCWIDYLFCNAYIILHRFNNILISVVQLFNCFCFHFVSTVSVFLRFNNSTGSGFLHFNRFSFHIVSTTSVFLGFNNSTASFFDSFNPSQKRPTSLVTFLLTFSIPLCNLRAERKIIFIGVSCWIN